MGTLQLLNGNLLEAKETFIAHQCNCISHRAAHLAKSVFDRFPYADIYDERTPNWIPPPSMQMGDIVVCGNGLDCRFVINMLAQMYPGSPRYPGSTRDGFLARQKAFQSCLDKITLLPELDSTASVAFPYRIGCGVAGGSWTVYRRMIRVFAEKVNASVRVYKL